MDVSHYPIEQLRNIGLIAHIDAGKTTVTERMLYYTGVTHQMGSVDSGNTVTDWMPQERQRGITIVSAAVTAIWRDHQINIIDTPGHIDFTAEVQRALRVLDGGVVIFDAVQGVEPQSETVWRQANHFRVPRICFVNKMDRVGADFLHCLASMRLKLGADAAAVQLPLGEERLFEGVIDLIAMEVVRWQDVKGAELQRGPIPDAYRQSAVRARETLIEKVAEYDDGILEAYLDKGDVDSDQLKAALRRATLNMQLFPVLCGAALHNQGIQPLLDATVDYLGSPLDSKPVKGLKPGTQHNTSAQEIVCPPDAEAPLAALVFKVVADPYAGKMAYVRVYSGQLHSGQQIYNPRTGNSQRIGRIVRVFANSRESIDAVYAGEIDAILSLKECVTGDTLCNRYHPVLLENITFPEPVINLAVEPVSIKDRDTISVALQQLAEEDPTFKVRTDKDSGQTILSGMGELHLEVLVNRLEQEHSVRVRVGKPRVSYAETVSKTADRIEGRFVRQSGGHGQYGHVVLSVAPAERGSGIHIVNKVAGGAIPREFLGAVEKGIREATQHGLIGGNRITDLEVTLLDGSHHSVDSSELAFKTAAMMGFKQAVMAAGPKLLEPVFKLEISLPKEYMGDVLGQLASRRCDVTGTTLLHDGTEQIHALAPIAEMFGYATELRSATQGRGQFSMEFDHYADVPATVAQGIMAPYMRRSSQLRSGSKKHHN